MHGKEMLGLYLTVSILFYFSWFDHNDVNLPRLRAPDSLVYPRQGYTVSRPDSLVYRRARVTRSRVRTIFYIPA
jgi:hypothetical protein